MPILSVVFSLSFLACVLLIQFAGPVWGQLTLSMPLIGLSSMLALLVISSVVNCISDRYRTLSTLISSRDSATMAALGLIQGLCIAAAVAHMVCGSHVVQAGTSEFVANASQLPAMLTILVAGLTGGQDLFWLSDWRSQAVKLLKTMPANKARKELRTLMDIRHNQQLDSATY